MCMWNPFSPTKPTNAGSTASTAAVEAAAPGPEQTTAAAVSAGGTGSAGPSPSPAAVVAASTAAVKAAANQKAKEAWSSMKSMWDASKTFVATGRRHLAVVEAATVAPARSTVVPVHTAGPQIPACCCFYHTALFCMGIVHSLPGSPDAGVPCHVCVCVCLEAAVLASGKRNR